MLLAIWERFRGHAEYGEWVHEMLQNLNNFYGQLEHPAHILPAANQRRLQEAVDGFFSNYRFLHCRALDAGQRMWHGVRVI